MYHYLSSAFTSLWQIRGDFLKAFGETCIMLGISTVFSVVFGGVLGTILFVTDKNQMSEHRVIHKVCDKVVDMVRAFPFVILMIALLPMAKWLIGTSIGPVAASIVLSIAGVFYFARLVEQNLHEVPRGIIEAATAMGTPPLTIILKVLFSEARSGLVRNITILIINLLSVSAAAGMIGGGGLGDLAIRYGYYRFQTEVMLFIVLVLIIIVMLIQTLGNLLSSHLDKR